MRSQKLIKMASTNSSSLWIITFFQGLHRAVEENRGLLEQGKAELDGLRKQLQNLETQREDTERNRKINDHVLQGQQELIRALEHNLEICKSSSTVHGINLALVTAAPRPLTPWPTESISQTSSESSFNPSLDY